MKVRISLLSGMVMLCLFVVGCHQPTTFGSGARYFASPSAAVKRITVMLEEKDWPQLAKYYDLADSPIDRTDLISGEFFYTKQEPAVAHPAGFWRYKHPFAPAFEFKSVRRLEEPGVVEVTVGVEIDQGDGMIQRGLQTFLMRRSERGYQIMPHKGPVF